MAGKFIRFKDPGDCSREGRKYLDAGLELPTQPPYLGTYEGRCVDAGIERVVKVLFDNGIQTTESCEGGEGHSFAEPTVRFAGDYEAGFRAFAIAIQHNLKPTCLRRFWDINNNELQGPFWEMTFVL